MYTAYLELKDLLAGGTLRPFLVFFAFVWFVWALKTVLGLFYRPTRRSLRTPLRTTAIVPVYNEDPAVFRRVLRSIIDEGATELIVVVDGGDPDIAALAEDYATRVIRIPKAGKRTAIAAGFGASDPTTDVVLVVDSDTIWLDGCLRELLKPFADPKVGGVTPRQRIFDRDLSGVRRLCDWIEDLRYHGTVPAQSVLGQIGCLAGRTIAYRRAAFEPAVEALVAQRVLGLEMHIGDDRVLTNELLRRGWRTVYQETAVVETDCPDTWRTFWRQQLRWGRSSQRETILSLGWLWRRPYALFSFLADMITPFFLYGVMVMAVANALRGRESVVDHPLWVQLAFAYGGMLLSIGIRQLPHFRRHPADALGLPLFVLQLTFLMAPIRIAAFATMFHQSWTSRPALAPPIVSPAHVRETHLDQIA